VKTSFGRKLLVAGTAGSILLGGAAAIGQSGAAQRSSAGTVKGGVDAWQSGNYAAAVDIWRPLANRGDPDAQFNMGQAYKLGRGVSADIKIAQSWYQKAAQQGHGQAQANLGLILFQNGDRTGAMPWIRKAADAGDARAQYVLGTALFNGDLIGRDWVRAYAMMTLAAGQGLPQAAAHLAEMDKHVPLQQRQQGIALARKLEGQGVSTAAAPAAPPIQAQPMPRQTVAAATQPPRPAPGAAAGGWRVQLGAFGSPANAQKHWAGLRARVGALSGLTPYTTPAGAMTRLQAGPVASKAAADQICAAAKAAGSACFPVKP
jgi:TPR repeat protein